MQIEPTVIHVVVKDSDAKAELEEHCLSWRKANRYADMYIDGEQSLGSWKRKKKKKRISFDDQLRALHKETEMKRR